MAEPFSYLRHTRPTQADSFSPTKLIAIAATDYLIARAAYPYDVLDHSITKRTKPQDRDTVTEVLLRCDHVKLLRLSLRTEESWVGGLMITTERIQNQEFYDVLSRWLSLRPSERVHASFDDLLNRFNHNGSVPCATTITGQYHLTSGMWLVDRGDREAVWNLAQFRSQMEQDAVTYPSTPWYSSGAQRIGAKIAESILTCGLLHFREKRGLAPHCNSCPKQLACLDRLGVS